MHWVSLDLLPGWCTTSGSVTDLNRLGITLGVGAQANTDEGPEGVPVADLQTAHYLGRRITETARSFTTGPPRTPARLGRAPDRIRELPRRASALAKES
jgi:hypothetical protein